MTAATTPDTPAPTPAPTPDRTPDRAAAETTAETAAETPPTPPAPPPPMALHWAALYIAASIFMSLTQGLGQGFVTANIAQFAGDLGTTTTQASWLLAVYMIPRTVMPLLLIKIRMQFGLRRFAEISIVIYMLVIFSSLWIVDLRSAVVVQLLSGLAAAPLSTLTFLYALEPLSPTWKVRLGLPIVMAGITAGPMMARVVSPYLIGDGGLMWMHLMSLGQAMVSLSLVFLLPLRPMPHMKLLQLTDLLSVLLMAIGFGGVIIGFVMGPIYWWTSFSWIGWTMIAGVGGLAALLVLELNRKEPMIDVRWLVSPPMLLLTMTLFLYRFVLSEQSSGAPRMFQALGLHPSQTTTIYALMCAAYVLGALACVAWMRTDNVPQFHLIALLIMAAATWTDAHATVDTRPVQMFVTQAMIAFASQMFITPAMMVGLGAALAKGPHYLMSFIIMFLTTQSVGSMIGSGTFVTLINWRQAFHMQVLSEQLLPTSAITAAETAQRMALLAPQIPDVAMRKAEALSEIARNASTQAYVMAYNDVYFLIFLLASAAAAALLLHMFRNRLAARMGHAETETAK